MFQIRNTELDVEGFGCMDLENYKKKINVFDGKGKVFGEITWKIKAI